MGYGEKEYSPRVKALIERYQEAKLRYSNASRELAKLRLEADYPNAPDVFVAKYARARKKFKNEAREFHLERTYFQVNIQTALRAKPSVDAEIERATRVMPDAVVLDRVEDYSHKELQELKKQTLLQEEFESGKYDELIKELKTKQSAKEQFLSSKDKNDPTLGDFEPL